MKVFVSSLMGGHFGSLREAAAAGIGALGYQVVRAEDFRVSADSPREACLSEVRSAGTVVLILGAEYGSLQESGKSATHEEYLEAKHLSLPVLAFIEESAEPVGEQAAFVSEVRNWIHGQYTESFTEAEDLRAKVTRGLHRLALARTTSPLDDGELASRARALLPEQSHSSQAQLVVAIASGPIQTVIRPATIGDRDLFEFLQREALAGPEAALDLSSGTEKLIQGNAMVLHQPHDGAWVSLHESGSVVVAQSATGGDHRASFVPVIVKEDIAERIERALRLAGRVLDHVDPQRRISHISAAALLANAGFLGWTTRQEQAGNTSEATMNPFGQNRVEVSLSPTTRARAELLSDSNGLAEDLTALLSRKANRSPYR
ncbi:DUF4062 domain-containing protein [Candidatus Poriferisocius sp.]|uniref:DUF4062 domain-containing protein n=1 Tax=Candidatus Poriferisocius sp. TaxID=3101276 RepID=UPI003B59E5C6